MYFHVNTVERTHCLTDRLGDPSDLFVVKRIQLKKEVDDKPQRAAFHTVTVPNHLHSCILKMPSVLAADARMENQNKISSPGLSAETEAPSLTQKFPLLIRVLMVAPCGKVEVC